MLDICFDLKLKFHCVCGLIKIMFCFFDRYSRIWQTLLSFCEFFDQIKWQQRAMQKTTGCWSRSALQVCKICKLYNVISHLTFQMFLNIFTFFTFLLCSICSFLSKNLVRRRERGWLGTLKTINTINLKLSFPIKTWQGWRRTLLYQGLA